MRGDEDRGVAGQRLQLRGQALDAVEVDAHGGMVEEEDARPAHEGTDQEDTLVDAFVEVLGGARADFAEYAVAQAVEVGLQAEARAQLERRLVVARVEQGQVGEDGAGRQRRLARHQADRGAVVAMGEFRLRMTVNRDAHDRIAGQAGDAGEQAGNFASSGPSTCTTSPGAMLTGAGSRPGASMRRAPRSTAGPRAAPSAATRVSRALTGGRSKRPATRRSASRMRASCDQ